MVFHRKEAENKVHTHYTNPVVWPSYCSASLTTPLVSILTNLERRECGVCIASISQVATHLGDVLVKKSVAFWECSIRKS